MRGTAGTAGLAALALTALVLAACDDGSSKRMWNRIQADNARANPPELWSAQVLPERADAPPVKVCVDAALRDGFKSLEPQVGGQSCVRSDSGTKTANGAYYRCVAAGTEYAVSVAVTGDAAADFTTATAIHPVRGGNDFSQTVRYRKLGLCPAGWAIGDATDREGRRVSGVSR